MFILEYVLAFTIMIISMVGLFQFTHQSWQQKERLEQTMRLEGERMKSPLSPKDKKLSYDIK